MAYQNGVLSDPLGEELEARKFKRHMSSPCMLASCIKPEELSYLHESIGLSESEYKKRRRRIIKMMDNIDKRSKNEQKTKSIKNKIKRIFSYHNSDNNND